MPKPANTWQGMFEPSRAVQTNALNPITRTSLERIINFLRLLEGATKALRAGQAVPAPAAEWLASGFERFLNEGGDLTAHLGLKPRRGGAGETPKALKRGRERDSALCIAIQEMPGGSAWAKANDLFAYLRDGGDPPCPAAEQLRRVVQDKKFHVPSPRRMVEIIKLDPKRVGLVKL